MKTIYHKLCFAFIFILLSPYSKAGFTIFAYRIIANHSNGEKCLERKDTINAIKYFTLAAKCGHSESQFELGKIYWTQSKYENAFGWFQKGYEKGNVHCTTFLGIMYDNGLGVTENKKMATSLFLDAFIYNDTVAEEKLRTLTDRIKINAEKGDADYQLFLGIMYEAGIVLPKDTDKAFYWYKESTKKQSLFEDLLKGLMQRLERDNQEIQPPKFGLD